MKDFLQKKQQLFFQSVDHIHFPHLLYKGDFESLVDLYRQIVYSYFEQFGRDFSWRRTRDPYYIFISEIMLQQTQTNRVEAKFEQFIKAIPSFKALARAELQDVLVLWQGFGYNRRAKYLHLTAKKIVDDFSGKLPENERVLQSLPGIGQATAASICAFAFNKPTVFIETNIRVVFLHFFFRRSDGPVRDREIMPFVAETVDKQNSRFWYYALTDYGVGLKRLYPLLNKKSAHYTRQSRFEGSNRQIRGRVIKALVSRGALDQKSIVTIVERESKHVCSVLKQLVKEGFIKRTGDIFKVSS